MNDDLEPLSAELSITAIEDVDDADPTHSGAAGFEDVLPFLLQAQDIVMKLESRVMELEEDLFVSRKAVYAEHRIVYHLITLFRPYIPNMNTIGQNG
jgi:hypothetical protein